MVESGLDTIRTAELLASWDRIEVDRERYDFSWLDAIFDLAEERGIGVVLGTGTNCPPIWMLDQYPDLQVVSSEGVPYPTATSWSWACKDNPGMRLESERWITLLADRYGWRPGLVGWQLDNEPGFPFVARHAESMEVFCYCHHTEEAVPRVAAPEVRDPRGAVGRLALGPDAPPLQPVVPGEGAALDAGPLGRRDGVARLAPLHRRGPGRADPLAARPAQALHPRRPHLHERLHVVAPRPLRGPHRPGHVAARQVRRRDRLRLLPRHPEALPHLARVRRDGARLRRLQRPARRGPALALGDRERPDRRVGLRPGPLDHGRRTSPGSTSTASPPGRRTSCTRGTASGTASPSTGGPSWTCAASRPSGSTPRAPPSALRGSTRDCSPPHSRSRPTSPSSTTGTTPRSSRGWGAGQQLLDAITGAYRALAGAGFACEFVAFEDLSDVQAKLLVLPATMLLPAEAGEAIATFVRDGGHLLTFAKVAMLDGAGWYWNVRPGAGLVRGPRGEGARRRGGRRGRGDRARVREPPRLARRGDHRLVAVAVAAPDGRVDGRPRPPPQRRRRRDPPRLRRRRRVVDRDAPLGLGLRRRVRRAARLHRARVGGGPRSSRRRPRPTACPGCGGG